ncbi:UDP-glucose--hexose-1-phosphate uridylyltransferase [Granulicella tundricola]|uniref:Galactose-1-phosphate uridylyltransferase n=1 Tax=Granulicella tundricola (strain ATCC BAA-1859 / DSM 23138 / MP5ACTX9) TaxID=1198114 RepID=E8X1J7_GRATM|nr:UDP-glucose--hexose-1-phosphate uridylyltransferase [Granulicella tundricola]ADW70232.1 galactose-1-phosphate uridylyltransferase [Granulicella tundricola MP5ACTX9]
MLSNSRTQPHRRYNPLRRQWVLVSPQRTARPWQGQLNKPVAPDQQPYDPTCYLCPGNPRTSGDVNPQYPGVFAFDNDFPALLPPSATDLPAEHNGLLIAEPENGRCRVLCFHPNHSLTLSQMTPPDIEAVINVWAHETLVLGSDLAIQYVQIFENRGAMMGSSNPHPHCQIWATGHIPEEPAAEAESQLAHFQQHNRTLLADYLTQELKEKVRIVSENETFVAVVPFWAVWPFETLILPRDPIASFVDLTPAQTTGLADILKRVTTRYDNLFGVSFPYTMGFHQAPTDGEPHPEIHFHAHFYPPLLRSAEIRKFMVGFEMLGMPQRDITPEKAAEMLRAAPEL